MEYPLIYTMQHSYETAIQTATYYAPGYRIGHTSELLHHIYIKHIYLLTIYYIMRTEHTIDD